MYIKNKNNGLIFYVPFDFKFNNDFIEQINLSNTKINVDVFITQNPYNKIINLFKFSNILNFQSYINNLESLIETDNKFNSLISSWNNLLNIPKYIFDIEKDINKIEELLNCKILLENTNDIILNNAQKLIIQKLYKEDFEYFKYIKEIDELLVDEVYIIQLMNLPDRANNLITQLREKVGIIPSIYTANIPPSSAIYNIKCPLYNRGVNALGCLLSHRGVLCFAKSIKNKRILVFEDDAKIRNTDNFISTVNYYIEKNINCDVIHLGLEKGCKLRTTILENGFKKIINNYLYGTYAYILNLQNVDTFIRKIDEYKLPIDMILMDNKCNLVYKDFLVEANPNIKSTISK